MWHSMSNRYLTRHLWNYQPKHDKLGQGQWQITAEKLSSEWLDVYTLEVPAID